MAAGRGGEKEAARSPRQWSSSRDPRLPPGVRDDFIGYERGEREEIRHEIRGIIWW